MAYQHILTDIKNKVLTITLNRPKVLNALNTQLKLELVDIFKRANIDHEIRAIVLTGSGERAFCAGQDLNESQNVNEETAKEWVDEFDRLYRTIKAVEKPIVASINGAAAGSGLQLALLADIRIASENARFGMTEVNVGLPCIIGSTMFWEVMGKTKTTDLILSGRLLNTKEAKDYDLITRIAEDQDDLKVKTTQLAEELANKPPVAVKTNKYWFNKLSELNFNACMEFAKEAHTISYSSKEPQIMMEKFLTKAK